MNSAAGTGRRTAFALAAAAALLAGSAAASRAGDGDGVLDTTLVSRATGLVPGGTGDAGSFDPALSADGRYVAFESDADNLDGASNDSVKDIFLRDSVTNATTLVSRASGAAGAASDGDSEDPAISADGRYVAFSSDADNIDGDSNDSFGDIFIRDTVANTTALVSRPTGIVGAGDGTSTDPAIAADGQHVAFQSFAGNIDGDSSDAINDVFVRDTQANVTTFVSRATGISGTPADNNSTVPSVSADGRFVAFESFASNLGASNPAVFDVFVRDTVASTTALVSRATGVAGVAGDGQSVRSSISASGRFIAFDSDADNLEGASDDSATDVFVRDTVANTTTLASRATGVAGAVGDDASTFASITADGRHVAFHSDADNLDPDSDDSFADILVRDTSANTTTLVSRATGTAGAVGDESSFLAAISSNGGFVAFHSNADNLDPDSSDAVTDVFLRELTDTSPAVPQPPPAQPLVKLKKCKKKARAGKKKMKKPCRKKGGK